MNLVRWWGRQTAAQSLPQPQPDQPFCAIGDIHGRADLLGHALDAVDGQVVCVGDYVDRGPDSAGVLRLLQSRPDVVCLMGNHEEMMLDFFANPEGAGPRWLRSGGRDTLASYGVLKPETNLTRARDVLRAELGEAAEDWLTTLPSLWQSGNVAVTHAGADPCAEMGAQSEKHLRWGHPKFGHVLRRDGVWVVRGHVIQDEAFMLDGTIQIDTGAWRTGRLTLAHISAEGVRFEEIRR